MSADNGANGRQRLMAVLRWLGRMVCALVRRWRGLVEAVGKPSLIAGLAVVVLNFISLGALGALLYFPVAPLLLPFYPPFSAWLGDWVWPAMIGVGFLWSWAFLLAGAVVRRMQRSGQSRAARLAAYLLILWLWALLLWWAMLASEF